MKKGFTYALAVGLLAISASASASVVTFEFTGPGGHSLRAYGNTSALHAAARAAIMIQKAVPEAVITDLNGGNSVNSIAADASFRVRLDEVSENKLQLVEQAVQQGVDQENAFRNVKKGDMKKGTPVYIQYKMIR